MKTCRKSEVGVALLFAAIAVSLVASTWKKPTAPSVESGMAQTAARIRDKLLGCVPNGHGNFCEKISQLRRANTVLVKSSGPNGTDYRIKIVPRFQCTNGGLLLQFVASDPDGNFSWDGQDKLPLLLGDCSNETLPLGKMMLLDMVDVVFVRLTGSKVIDAPLIASYLFRVDGDYLTISNTSMKSAKIIASSLANANFMEVDAIDAVFELTDLHGASFVGSTLRNATFDRCDLENASFVGVDLTGASIRISNDFQVAQTLQTITWKNTTCPDGVSSASGIGRHARETCLGHLSPK